MAVYEKTGRKGKKIYYFRFTLDGQEHYRTVKEATCKEDAEKIEILYKSELLKGNYGLAEKRGSMLFEKLVEHYKIYAKNNKKTWETEEGKVEKIKNYFKGKKLKEITPAVIEGFKTFRKSEKNKKGEAISGATINRDLAMISKMFSIAVENKWTDENPATKKKVPRYQERDEIIRYLSDEEEKGLIEACEGEYAHLKLIMLTAIINGMRFSEVMKLKWKENVDLKQSCLIITKEMAKSKKQRIIPLSSFLLGEYKKLYKNKVNEYVFVNPKTGKPYGSIRKSWITLRNHAKIDPEFRFHDLRHHMATKAIDNGVPVTVVKDLLGHCSLNITQKYGHAKESSKRKAVECMSAGLESVIT